MRKTYRQLSQPPIILHKPKIYQGNSLMPQVKSSRTAPVTRVFISPWTVVLWHLWKQKGWNVKIRLKISAVLRISPCLNSYTRQDAQIYKISSKHGPSEDGLSLVWKQNLTCPKLTSVAETKIIVPASVNLRGLESIIFPG